MHIRFKDFKNSEILNESGIRNLRAIIKGFSKTEIYFHKDLDGVATAIATKEYFDKYYGLKLVDCHIIQYGNDQFVVPKAIENGKTLPILVDFASGNPQYTIQFDHHENQRGADNSVVLVKKAKSNAEIISDQLSYNQIFTSNDIDLIKTVDSADFAAKGLTADDIMNVFYSRKSELTAEQNRFMMGLVVNKLLLVYKNKNITVKSLNGKFNHVNRNFLECLVLDSTASLISLYNNIMHYIKNAKSIEYDGDIFDKSGPKWKQIHKGSKKFNKETNLTPREEIYNNLAEYIASRAVQFDKNKTSKGGANDMLKYIEDYGIIMQVNIGDVFKSGSYDRYVPFKNFPDANYLVTMYSMGLIQASGNPFTKKEGEYAKYADLHMGNIALELFNKVKGKFNGINVNLANIKGENETLVRKTISKKTDLNNSLDFKPVGFTFVDLINYFSDMIYKNGEKVSKEELQSLKGFYDKVFYDMTAEELDILREYEIPVIDIILSQSGGHKGITNISGLNYMKYVDAKVEANFGVKKEEDEVVGRKVIPAKGAYEHVMRLLANGYVHILKEKINMIRNGEEVTYDLGSLEFGGVDTNESHNKFIDLNNMLLENFEYFIIQNNTETSISRDEFLRYNFNHNHDGSFKMDIVDNKVIGRIETVDNNVPEVVQELEPVSVSETSEIDTENIVDIDNNITE